MVHIWSKGETLVVRLDGALDARAVDAVLGAAAAAEPGRRVEVDLAKALSVEDRELARLAGALALAGVTITGLRTHQRRVLRYLGAAQGI